MVPFRLMDLDILVQRGMKARPFLVKARDQQVNLSAVQYAIERILCFHAQNCLVCVVAQNNPNPEEVVSARDPLSLLCYEILSEKIPTMGFCVKKFDSRIELEDFCFDLCNRGYRGANPFATVRAMVDCPKLYTLISMSRALSIDGYKTVNIDIYNACDTELEVPMLAYPMLYVLKDKFPDRYKELYNLFIEENPPSADLAQPITMANFLKNKMTENVISDDECIDSIKMVLSLHEGLDVPINMSDYQGFNYDGAVTLLTGFNLKTALELIGVYQLNYTKQSSVINTYLRNKIESFISGQFSLDNSLSLQTDYFSEVSETVTTKDGEVVSDSRNDEFLSEEELLSEFL